MPRHLFFPSEQVDYILMSPPGETGKHMLGMFQNASEQSDFPIHILEDNAVMNVAEVHKTEGDLWQCLQGQVTFTCGGELIDSWVQKKSDGSLNENEIRGSGIRNGETLLLRPGDWLWVPSGVPHQHGTEGMARLLIIKIPM